MSFSFGAPSGGSAASTPSSSTFSFGTGTNTGSTSNTGTSFSFTPSASSNTSSTASGSSTPSTTFSFNTGSSSTSSTASTPSFSFSGAGSASKPTTTTPSFSFGGSGTTTGTPSTNTGSSFLSGTSSNTGTNTFGFGGTSTLFGGSTMKERPKSSSQITTRTGVNESTKFEELPEDWKRMMIKIEQNLLNDQTLCNELDAHSFSKVKELQDRSNDIENLIESRKQQQRRELKSVMDLLEEVRSQKRVADDMDMDVHRLTTAPHTIGQTRIHLPSPYFKTLLASFEARMQLYRSQIEEIEQLLSSSNRTAASDTSELFPELLQYQNETFLSLANRIAELHEAMQTLKALVLSHYKRNPYATAMDVDSQPSVKLDLPPLLPAPPQQTTTSTTPGFSNNSTFSFFKR